MTEYINLKKFQTINAIRSIAYGKRHEARTPHAGVILDLTIPCTFGVITYAISKKYNKHLFYFNGLNHYVEKVKYLLRRW